MSQNGITLAELQQKIAQKAWQDPGFEAEFMTDPKGTFEKYLQQKLPEELTIHAHYNTGDEIHFVIPRRPTSSSDELTDEDLERVAGGETPFVVLTVIATITGTIVSVGQAVQESGW